MIRILIVLILLCSCTLVAPIALAGQSYYLPCGDGSGRYVCANATGNDGWYYTYSGGKYYRAAKIAPQTVIKYSADWKTELVRVLNQQKDNEFFLQALAESGLSKTPVVQQANSYASVTQTATGPVVAAQTLQQVAPLIGTIDLESLIEKNQRLVESLAAGTTQANNGVQAHVTGLTEVAKIQAAGNALVASIEATAKTAQSRQETSVSVSAPVYGTGQQQNTLTPLAVSPQNANTLGRLRAEALLIAKCGKCHVDADKGGFRLTELDASTFDKVWSRVTTRDEKKIMPPVDSGASPLSAADLLILSKGR